MIKDNIPYFSLDHMHKMIRAELDSAFSDILEKNWFVLGSQLDQFEKDFASYINVKYALGVGNGYDALKISLLALKLRKNDEVLVPAHTFSASILAILHAGLKPVLIDIDSGDFNIDINQIKNKINKNSRVIMPVHMYGNPCDMNAIKEIAVKYNLIILEDFAQAVGSEYNHSKTGGTGTINAASFYPAKIMGALGDGGIITTNDPEIAENCKWLRNYGYCDKYKLEIPGFNSRLDEIQAAFLSVKLNYLDEWINNRKEIAGRYILNFSGNPHIGLPRYKEKVKPNYHIFPIRTAQRNQLRLFLKEQGIDTRVHYPIPPHLQKGLTILGYKKQDFPVTEMIAKTTLSLPIYPGLSMRHVDLISEKINTFTKKLQVND